jgi:hypothetical protein
MIFNSLIKTNPSFLNLFPAKFNRVVRKLQFPNNFRKTCSTTNRIVEQVQ